MFKEGQQVRCISLADIESEGMNYARYHKLRVGEVYTILQIGDTNGYLWIQNDKTKLWHPPERFKSLVEKRAHLPKWW